MAFNYNGSKLGHSQPMAEINTTPLVDVMLVLLVIFIITAPLFHQAVPVDLPKVDSTQLDNKPKVVQVALDGEGRLFIDGTRIDSSTISERLGAAVQSGQPPGREQPPEMHLRADRATRYERVAEVMAAAQKVGITKIAFVTDTASAGSAR